MIEAGIFFGGMMIGGTLGVVGMAALCMAGASGRECVACGREERAEVTHGFSDRLYVIEEGEQA